MTHRRVTHLAELRNLAILYRLVRFRAQGTAKTPWPSCRALHLARSIQILLFLFAACSLVLDSLRDQNDYLLHFCIPFLRCISSSCILTPCIPLLPPQRRRTPSTRHQWKECIKPCSSTPEAWNHPLSLEYQSQGSRTSQSPSLRGCGKPSSIAWLAKKP